MTNEFTKPDYLRSAVMGTDLHPELHILPYSAGALLVRPNAATSEADPP